jgi:RimJ/RimL family protein N-acetyltransferase
MIETARLLLRPWRDAELPILEAFSRDPVIMEHFGAVRPADDTAARFGRMRDWESRLGFTFWAAVRKADGAVIGNMGLKPLTIPWPAADDIEIGWLLRQDAWGQGYVREGAEAILAHGLTLAPRVIAMTAATNSASWGLMRRLGMAHAPELDFDHPEVPVGRYRPHLVYVKERA